MRAGMDEMDPPINQDTALVEHLTIGEPLVRWRDTEPFGDHPNLFSSTRVMVCLTQSPAFRQL
jgi:hypothetical protein